MGGLYELWWYSKLHLDEKEGEKSESVADGVNRLSLWIARSLGVDVEAKEAKEHDDPKRLV